MEHEIFSEAGNCSSPFKFVEFHSYKTMRKSKMLIDYYKCVLSIVGYLLALRSTSNLYSREMQNARYTAYFSAVTLTFDLLCMCHLLKGDL